MDHMAVKKTWMWGETNPKLQILGQCPADPQPAMVALEKSWLHWKTMAFAIGVLCQRLASPAWMMILR